jgi:hypothetical protein
VQGCERLHTDGEYIVKTAPTNKKVREIINLVKEGKLIPRPEFQRRLVWTIVDKNHFLDSIIKGYPFPEIYVADGDVDLETGTGTQLLVDGLQRVSTMVQYFEADPLLKLTSIPHYRDLEEAEKRAFLQYDVAVRDLGSISRDEIIEVFKRINATKYSLTDIEVNNAVYAGALRQFAEKVAVLPFFLEHNVFSSLDYKRMGDLRFALQIIVTMLGGYQNRDDRFEEFLDRYNDEFDKEKELYDRIMSVLDFINECGFYSGSRVWRKADLFTLIIEIDLALNRDGIRLDPMNVVLALQGFYESIESRQVGDNTLPGIYYKTALQASNDRINRVRRGAIIGGLIRGESQAQILQGMEGSGLV